MADALDRLEQVSAERQKDADPAIRLLKQEIAQLKKRLGDREGNVDLILQEVREVLDDPIEITISTPPKQPKTLPEEIAILHLSDLQLGKVTESYDSATAAKRVAKAAELTLEIAEVRRKAARIEKCRVYLGGDMIEGETIFPGQAYTIDCNVFEQAIKRSPEAMASCILSLLGGFKEVHVMAVAGNHGRSAPKGVGASKKTNWDNVAFETTRHIVEKSLVRTKRANAVSWDLPSQRAEEWYAVDRVFDWGNLMVHGHQIRGGFAGFPWYGAAKKAWGWIDTVKQHWDYLWTGHFHTFGSIVLNERMALMNGTTESSNEHAAEELAACGHPVQRLAFFNAGKGMISDNMLQLDDARKPQMRARN